MAVKYNKSPKNIPTFSIARPSKIYPNCDFWFENLPSGNPAQYSKPFEDYLNQNGPIFGSPLR
jgi:hypothetical protein